MKNPSIKTNESTSLLLHNNKEADKMHLKCAFYKKHLPRQHFNIKTLPDYNSLPNTFQNDYIIIAFIYYYNRLRRGEREVKRERERQLQFVVVYYQQKRQTDFFSMAGCIQFPFGSTSTSKVKLPSPSRTVCRTERLIPCKPDEYTVKYNK